MPRSGSEENSDTEKTQERSGYERRKDLFLALRGKSSEEQILILEKECGDDAELRESVLEFLELERADDDASYLNPEEETTPDRFLGKTIDRYFVKRIIGRGGMSRVYEAIDEFPKRTVALKLIDPQLVSPASLSRFEFEAQLLGWLDHPGIAKLYHAGTYRDGKQVIPFFAMEFVPNAQTVTRYATSHHLNMIERLELITRVCDAVHHAHLNGIIHRDLKPDNILINSAGQPKLIDFGISRTIDRHRVRGTAHTQAGQLIGTPPYMSPEQLTLDPKQLDIRSDVYSLGVVTYELLCGEIPFENSTFAVKGRPDLEPKFPKSVRKKVRGDIEAIVGKALRSARESRYESAGSLAQDLRRHLRGEVIQARRSSAATKAQKWIRREPLRAVAACFLLILMFTLILLGGLRIREVFLVAEKIKVSWSAGDLATVYQTQAQLPPFLDRLFFGDDYTSVPRLRKLEVSTPLARVLQTILSEGEEEARLLAARYLEFNGVGAHPPLARFLLRSEDKPTTSTTTSQTRTIARLFHDRPDKNPVSSHQSAPFRDRLVELLRQPSNDDVPLYALSALSGVGTAREIPRILSWLTGLSDSGRSFAEAVRLGLLCIESILRRSQPCGYFDQVLNLDHEKILERTSMLFENARQENPLLNGASLQRLFTTLAFTRREARLPALTIEPQSKLFQRSRILAARKHPRLEGRVLEISSWLGEDTPEPYGQIEYHGVLAGSYDRTELSQELEARILAHVGILGLDLDLAKRIFHQGWEAGQEHIRGIYRQREPDCDTHLGALFEESITPLTPISIPRIEPTEPPSSFASVDFQSGCTQGIAEQIEVSLTSPETHIKTCEDSPLSKFVRLGLPGYSAMEFRFTLSPDVAPAHLEVRLEIQKALRNQLPHRGEGRISVYFDKVALAENVLVNTGQVESFTFSKDMPPDLMTRPHSLTVRLHSRATTTIRILRVEVGPKT